jgi:hypothetical protein
VIYGSKPNFRFGIRLLNPKYTARISSVLTSAQNRGGNMRRFDSPEVTCERQLLAEVAIGRLAVLPNTGRSDERKQIKFKIRFRPMADFLPARKNPAEAGILEQDSC